MINCEFCYKSFEYQSYYKRHLKTHLKNAKSIIQKEVIFEELGRITENTPEKKYVCPSCNSKFVSEYNLERHIKNSCIFQQICNLIDKDLLSKSEKEKLVKKLQPDIKSESTINIDNSLNIDKSLNIDNLNLTINVLNVGNENIEMIKTPEYIQKIVGIIEKDSYIREIGRNKYQKRLNQKSMDQAILETFTDVNCNPDYPENHNLYVPSKKPNYPFEVREENGWRTSNDIKDIQKLVILTKDNLLKSYQYNENRIDPNIKNDHMTQLDGNYGEVEWVEKKLCKDILMTAYNNKSILKPSYRESKKKLNLVRRK